MGFTYDDWKQRIKNRMDITGMVTHLTRPVKKISKETDKEINQLAVDNLIKILEDKKINGSTTDSGFIIGKKSAVCLQDAPFYSVIQNIEYEKQINKTSLKIRYSGIGLAFSKQYIYNNGGRPVIYDKTDDAKEYLPENQHWRIVNFDLNNDSKIIDWTHEREWRIPNEFIFAYNFTHVLLYDKETYDYFLKKCNPEIINELHGITILKGMLM